MSDPDQLEMATDRKATDSGSARHYHPASAASFREHSIFLLNISQPRSTLGGKTTLFTEHRVDEYIYMKKYE